MEATTSQACKFILTTYDDGKTNKFYDSTFRLRPPFRPNANGQYKVTINECLFNNNEPTLREDTDYYEFTVKYKDDATDYKDTYKLKKDVFTQSNRDIKKIVDLLCGIDPADHTVNKVTSIELYDGNGELVNADDYTTPTVEMRLTVNDFDNVESVTMDYTTNFGYLLNHLKASDTKLEGTRVDKGSEKYYSFTFQNLRFGGAYLYVLKTPLQSTVPTYNAINQGYNVVACVYNTVAFHNLPIEMCSSMEIVANELSNLRIELVNDQYESVPIRCPMYIQLTVSNE